MVFAPPEASWNTLLLVLNCGGGDAASRLAGNRDSLTAIRAFGKYTPDWKALEVALRTPQTDYEIRYEQATFITVTPEIMCEYVRFLSLFKSLPHGSVAPPPTWPRLPRNGTEFLSSPWSFTNSLSTIWHFHSNQDSYAEDCVLLTGNEIPYYEYVDRYKHSEGLVAYRQTFDRYVEVYGAPLPKVWPDVDDLEELAEQCNDYLDWVLKLEQEEDGWGGGEPPMPPGDIAENVYDYLL
jgi:hypothetical protein